MKECRHHQKGFGLIAAIVVLVAMVALAAAIQALSTGQARSSAADVQSARALQVAAAGVEWGLFRALQNASCVAASSWVSPDYPDFTVTVNCASSDYKDGETAPGVALSLRVFQVAATACNSGAAACPLVLPAFQPFYVERQLHATAYCNWNGVACTGPAP